LRSPVVGLRPLEHLRVSYDELPVATEVLNLDLLLCESVEHLLGVQGAGEGAEGGRAGAWHDPFICPFSFMCRTLAPREEGTSSS